MGRRGREERDACMKHLLEEARAQREKMWEYEGVSKLVLDRGLWNVPRTNSWEGYPTGRSADEAKKREKGTTDMSSTA